MLEHIDELMWIRTTSLWLQGSAPDYPTLRNSKVLSTRKFNVDTQTKISYETKPNEALSNAETARNIND